MSPAVPASAPQFSLIARRAVVRILVLAVAVALAVLTTASTASAQSPELRIEKATNGSDADTAPGPTLNAGEPVTWTYEISVSGTETLFDLLVSDNSGVTPRCDTNNDGVVEDRRIHPGPLNPGQSFVCTATGTAHSEGLFASVATVTASNLSGAAVFQATDASYYTTPAAIAVAPGLTIQTLVNGQEANAAPGPRIQEGETVTWSYVIRNTGNVDLSDIQVRNTAGVPVDCGGGTSIIVGPVAPDTSRTCTSVESAAGAGSGARHGVGEATAIAIDPETGGIAGDASAQDAAAYTPVVLPGALAFTGPSAGLVELGLLLSLTGAVLCVGCHWLGRRPRISTEVTAAAD